MKRKPLKFEERYPTQAARFAADKVVDALPLETTLGEAIRLFEWHYLDAGGVVKGSDVR